MNGREVDPLPWAIPRALVTSALLLTLTGCGVAARTASAPRLHKLSTATRPDPPSPAQPTSTYQWPDLSGYRPFAGSLRSRSSCVASSQLEAATISTPEIVQCWAGTVQGHHFVYAAFFTADKQGDQLTVDGRTYIQATSGAPGVVYQFGGDYACTGSGAAAWMVAVDLATGQSYNPAFDKQQTEIADRYCASPDNSAVLASKYVIGIPVRVPMK